MSYRCPYCRHLFEAFRESKCPACGRVLRHPDKWRSPRPEPSARSRTPSRIADSSRYRQPLWMVFVSRPRFLIWVLGGSILVVGVLLSANIKTAVPYRPPTKTFQTRRELVVIRTALEWFYTHCKRYPTTEEGLRALVRNPGIKEWQGYYLEALPPDLWGHPFQYSSDTRELVLYSSGPDGKPGTEDDIPSPPPDYKALARRLAKDKR